MHSNEIIVRKAPDQKETKLDLSGLDEFLEERRRRLENKPPPKSNKELQQAYRERHGEDLRKAHRVATALMSLRGHGRYYPEFTLKRVLDAISNFLTADEMKLFLQTACVNTLRAKTKKRKREN